VKKVKKIIIFVAMVLLLSSLATPIHALQEVDELREHAYIRIFMVNSTFGGEEKEHWFILNNPDKRQMFISMQLVPYPLDTCYNNWLDCNKSNYDVTYEVLFDGGIEEADVTSCWNWWSLGGVWNEPLAEQNRTSCPIINIPFSPSIESYNITFNMTSSVAGKGKPSLMVRVFGFSTAYSDKTATFSPTADSSVVALGDLLTVNINIWKLIYYDLIIALVIIGALLIVGGIPIMLKWIITKARG